LPGKDVAVQLLGSSEMADTMRHLEAGVDMDIPVSRQHFIGKASISKNQFERFGYLDYDGRDVLAKWVWQAGNLWSGDAGYSNTSTLSNYTQTQSVERNVRTAANSFVNADFLLHPGLHLHFGASSYDITYEAQAQRASDFTLNSVESGVNYASRANSTLGLVLRAMDGRYPNQQVVGASAVDNSFRQTELNGVASWIYSGKCTFRGNLGYTQRKHTQLAERDFSGMTGRATMNWMAGGSTAIGISVWRDIESYQDVISSYVVSNGIGINPVWNPTAKLNVQGGLRYETAAFEGDPGFHVAGLPLRSDTISSANLGLSYNALRSTQLSVSFQTEHRSSNYSSRAYQDSIVMGSIRFEL
jgi:exopolysaccharide biosynthesis operon protein EpsL